MLFEPPPHLSTPVHIWLTHSPGPYTCGPKLWKWYGIFQQNPDSKCLSTPPLPLYIHQERKPQGQIFLNNIDTRWKYRNNKYLKRSYGNSKKNIICFRESIYYPVWAHRTLLILINVGLQVLSNSIWTWDNI